VGCYIFGVRAGKGIVPLYAGQSKVTFKTECFTYHKLHRYGKALAKRRIGTPVMFFLVKEQGSSACIDDVEAFLIQNALVKNPDLANVHRKAWCITGVLRSGKGPPSRSARHLRRLLGLDTGSESRAVSKSPAGEPTKIRRRATTEAASSAALTAAPLEGPSRGSGASAPIS